MNTLQKKYQELEQYGHIYSRIEKGHYIITFHNINHQTEQNLRENVYPDLNFLQSKCLTDPQLIAAAKKQTPLEVVINKTKSMSYA